MLQGHRCALVVSRWPERVKLVLTGANDTPAGLGDLVPGAFDIAERLGNHQPRLVADFREDGELRMELS